MQPNRKPLSVTQRLSGQARRRSRMTRLSLCVPLALQKPPMLRVGAVSILLSLSLLLACAPVSLAATLPSVRFPIALTSKQGSHSEQGLAVLRLQDQTGAENDPAAFLEFSPTNHRYQGIFTFKLPRGVQAAAVTRLRLKVNYRGPAGAAQRWQWQARNVCTQRWVTWGDNRNARAATWMAFRFAAPGGPRCYINDSGDLELRYLTSTGNRVSKLDSLALVVTSNAGSLPPAFAPGAIAYNQYDFTTGQPVAQLRIINPDGTGDEEIPVALPEPGYPVWSRDGRLMALTSVEPLSPGRLSRDVFAFDPWTGARFNFTGFQDSKVVQGNESYYSYHLGLFKAFAPDGRKLAISAYNAFGDVYVGPPGPVGSGYANSAPVLWFATFLLDGPVSLMMGNINEGYHGGEGVDWAPDQDLLVYPVKIVVPFANSSVPSYVTALFLLEPVVDAWNTGRGRQLTFPQGRINAPFEPVYVYWEEDFLPAFSPDGQRLAYIRAYSLYDASLQPTQVLSLRIINADGSNDHEILRFHPRDYVSRISWSPDATQLVFDLGRRVSVDGVPLNLIDVGTAELYIINTNGARLRKLRGSPAAHPSWNPVPQP